MRYAEGGKAVAGIDLNYDNSLLATKKNIRGGANVQRHILLPI
jgi:hypothetical protein